MSHFDYERIAAEARIRPDRLARLSSLVRRQFPLEKAGSEVRMLRVVTAIRDGYIPVYPALEEELDRTLRLEGVAHHEAGHVLANLLYGREVAEVYIQTFVDQSPQGGVTLAQEVTLNELAALKKTNLAEGVRAIEARICTCYAGAVAEARYLGVGVNTESTIEVTDELEKRGWDFDPTEDSINVRFLASLAGWRNEQPHLERLLRLTKRIIAKPAHWGAVCEIADELLKTMRMNGTVARRVFDRHVRAPK